jgi:hypothetical protein
VFQLSAFSFCSGNFSFSAFQLFSVCPSRFQLLPGRLSVFQLFSVSAFALVILAFVLPHLVLPQDGADVCRSHLAGF